MSRTPDRPANRLKRHQSLPPAARPQPGGLVPLGTGGAGGSKRAGQADSSSVGRLATASRHGARELRRQGHRRDMNAHYINVKVDREERPDLDEIYVGRPGVHRWARRLAHDCLSDTRRPPHRRHHLPPVPRQACPPRQVLAHRRDQVNRRAEVAETTRDAPLPRAARPAARCRQVEGDWLAAVAEAADAEFDETHGGFGPP